MKNSKLNVHCLIAVVNFILLLLFIAPALHEFWHIVILFVYRCSYILQWKFLVGLSGKIEYLCSLSLQQERIVLLSGFIGNLLLGFFVLFLCFHFLSIKRYLISLFSLFTAFSFIFSSIAYFFNEEGDLVELFRTFGFRDAFLLQIIGVVALVLAFLVFKASFQMVVENYFVSKLKTNFDENRNNRKN